MLLSRSFFLSLFHDSKISSEEDSPSRLAAALSPNDCVLDTFPFIFCAPPQPLQRELEQQLQASILI